MKISEIYSSQYLKAIDLGGRAVQAQISDLTTEKFDDGQKLIVHFSGRDKALVCNKTNSGVIASSFGDETDAWNGKTIELYPDKVNYQGKIVDALRVRIPVPPAVTPSSADAPAAEDPNADIPW